MMKQREEALKQQQKKAKEAADKTIYKASPLQIVNQLVAQKKLLVFNDNDNAFECTDTPTQHKLQVRDRRHHFISAFLLSIVLSNRLQMMLYSLSVHSSVSSFSLLAFSCICILIIYLYVFFSFITQTPELSIHPSRKLTNCRCISLLFVFPVELPATRKWISMRHRVPVKRGPHQKPSTSRGAPQRQPAQPHQLC